MRQHTRQSGCPARRRRLACRAVAGHPVVRRMHKKRPCLCEQSCGSSSDANPAVVDLPLRIKRVADHGRTIFTFCGLYVPPQNWVSEVRRTRIPYLPNPACSQLWESAMTTLLASVSAKILSKADRLFTNNLNDILIELLQNSRRAGATQVDILTEPSGNGTLIPLRDDGKGIEDF